MPVLLRENRRSMVISPNKKLTELTKEALRPRSWYLPGQNVDIDPYTSVRKIFYEFPKKAFYGETDPPLDTTDRVPSVKNLTEKIVEKPSKKDNLERLVLEENLRHSLNRLDLKGTDSSPVPSIKSSRSVDVPTVRSTRSMDTNNNHSLSPKSKSNIIGYFSSKASDTASLKEESSTYADFYVPNAKPPSSTNFLRRSHKRRSYDPSKLRRFDDDVQSVSSAGCVSCKLPQSTEGIDSLVKNDDIVDPQPMIDRFLRDANKDICEGIYPAADDSISVRSDPSLIQTQSDQDTTQSDFIPWTKRFSFVEAQLIFTERNQDTLFKNRRGNKRFSSLRRQKSFTLENTATKERPTFRRAQTTLNNDTIKSRTSVQQFSLRRGQSETSTYSKKRRMSSSNSTLSKNSDYNGTLTKEGPRGYKNQNRDSKRNSKMAARYFFEGYQDKLREEIFSIDFPSNYDPTSDPTREEYVPLFKEYNTKLMGKTYQQLYYIRSRLSESARKSRFQCDGSFGCSAEYECTTPTQWV